MKKRHNRALVECLESRLLLSAASTQLHPTYQVFSSGGALAPAQTAGPEGFAPSDIRTAYGLNQISFGGVAGDGSGQTIAIIDAYNDPTIRADLHAFDVAFGLADPTFTVENQNGGTSLPGVDPAGAGNDNFEGEEALDVEWAHAMAPGAKIILVEAQDASPSNLFAAVNMARQQAGVSVISMSFGGNETSNEAQFDSDFTTPAGHIGVTFVASTGDSGEPGGYPAFSPNVVATGGTSLALSSLGTYQSETGWSGSGGGVSRFEAQPSYQHGIVTQSSTRRATPDVAFDADPRTGVAVYDSYNNGTVTPWEILGGTSVAAPAWAGIFAVADQGRAAAGEGTLDSRTNTLPMLYSAPASDFHDITTGNNGFSAGAGYDLVTGRGSPRANLLVPYLVTGTVPPPNPGGPASVASISADSTTVTEGDPLVLTAEGVVDSGDGAAVTFYEESNGVAGLQTGANGDFAFTAVTDGSNSITIDTTGLTGTFTFYAQVTDSSGSSATGTAAPFITINVTAPTNIGPRITSISATPASIETGDTLTLQAKGVSDPDGIVHRVFFYQETNGVPGLQTGAGGDFAFRPVSASSGYSIQLDTTGVMGSQTFYALAVDNEGNESADGADAPSVTINIANNVVPNAPKGLVANAVSPTTVNISFTEVDSGQNGFTIERSTDPAFKTFTQLFAITRPNLFTYSDTEASPNTKYYYRVEAFNTAGNSPFSNVATVTTPLPATHLVFAVQPATVTAGHLFAHPLLIEVEDAKGHVVTTDNSTVNIGLASQPGGATIGGTVSVQVVRGVATFNSLSFTKAGPYILLATDSGLASARSKAFTVNADAATAQLVIAQQPAGTLVGKTLTPLVVDVKDQFGNFITTAMKVSVTAQSPASALKGTSTVSTSGGVATFRNLSFAQAGNFTLQVTDTSLGTHPHAAFNETIAQATSGISAPPVAASYVVGQTISLSAHLASNAPAQIPFSGAVVIKDQNGNTLGTTTTTSTGQVKFALKGIAAGTYVCTLQYAGDENHTSAVSSSFVLRINAALVVVAHKG